MADIRKSRPKSKSERTNFVTNGGTKLERIAVFQPGRISAKKMPELTRQGVTMNEVIERCITELKASDEPIEQAIEGLQLQHPELDADEIGGL